MVLYHRYGYAHDRDRSEKHTAEKRAIVVVVMWVCFRCCRDLPFCVVVVAVVVVVIFHSVLLLLLLFLLS